MSIECPFCGSISETEYQIMLHIESTHPEERQTSCDVDHDTNIVDMTSTSNDPDQYVYCPLDGCDEVISLANLDKHLDDHNQEKKEEEKEPNSQTFVIYSPSNPLVDQNRSPFPKKISPGLDRPNQEDAVTSKRKRSESLRVSSKKAFQNILNKCQSPLQSRIPLQEPSKRFSKQVNKSELGPHANEARMSDWLIKLLQDGDGQVKTVNRMQDGKPKRVEICPNMMAGVIPVLAQLLDQDKSTEYAYLCHPSVKHVAKLQREGGFCGYRNIQMLCSYIITAESQGHESLNKKIPSIFEIQDFIETAWDLEINPQGRLETGGIRGTRKYIGTPEAQAMFICLGIAFVVSSFQPTRILTADNFRCNAEGIRSKNSEPAHEILFSKVESYFNDGHLNLNFKVRQTLLPPIYLQHSGHSMTIIGFEKKKDGCANIIVFDPSSRDAPRIIVHIDQKFQHESPEKLLKAYQKGAKQLQKHNEFEILKLSTLPRQ